MLTRLTRNFLVLLSTALLAAGLSACESDPGDSDATTDVENETDTGDDDMDMTDDDMEEGLAYRFVRIDDQSEMAMTEDGGADVDAIVLDKGDGTLLYADAVESFTFGPGNGLELDPQNALGAPDAFFAYPDTSECAVDGGFVSLGGIGGQLIVSMEGAIEENDTLTVLEVGNCDFDGGTAIQDDVEVFVSVAADDSRDWVALGGGGVSPDITFTIPALPFEPLE